MLKIRGEGPNVEIRVPPYVGIQSITMQRFQREVSIVTVSFERDGQWFEDGTGEFTTDGPHTYSFQYPADFAPRSESFGIRLNCIMFWGDVKEDAKESLEYSFIDHCHVDFIREGTQFDVNTRAIVIYTGNIARDGTALPDRLTVPQARAGLAIMSGVKPEDIEITIRG